MGASREVVVVSGVRTAIGDYGTKIRITLDGGSGSTLDSPKLVDDGR